MATTHKNTSFKIKAGGVGTTLGTVPEPGAIVSNGCAVTVNE